MKNVPLIDDSESLSRSISGFKLMFSCGPARCLSAWDRSFIIAHVPVPLALISARSGTRRHAHIVVPVDTRRGKLQFFTISNRLTAQPTSSSGLELHTSVHINGAQQCERLNPPRRTNRWHGVNNILQEAQRPIQRQPTVNAYLQSEE